MLLSFVMLHSHFVACVAGAYWNNIITIDIEKHALTTIEQWFTPQHCKPPDPIHCVVTMHLETLQGNCIDKTITQSTY